MKPSDIFVFNEAIKKYGAEHQMQIAEEECAELIQAISKVIRSNGSFTEDEIDHLAEEIADVEICIRQIKVIFGDYGLSSRVAVWEENKVSRLAESVNQPLVNDPMDSILRFLKECDAPCTFSEIDTDDSWCEAHCEENDRSKCWSEAVYGGWIK